MASNEIEEFDTKTEIRKVVFEYMKPLAEKVEASFDSVQAIQKKNEYIMRRHEDLDRSVKIDLNLRGSLTDIKRRIQQIVSSLS